MKMTLEYKNLTITMVTDGETPRDAADLASTLFSWTFEQPIELGILNEEDDTIYCEGIEPTSEREIEGL